MSCDFEGSYDPKIDIFKSSNFARSQPTGFKNTLLFALYLTVSEIMANLRFPGHVTLRGHVTPNQYFSKVVILEAVNPSGLKIGSVSLYLVRFPR